jgi:hypothetical protein
VKIKIKYFILGIIVCLICIWIASLIKCEVLTHKHYDEFKDAYNMYGTMDGQENVFLGVAFFSKKYKKLVADKVFYRG